MAEIDPRPHQVDPRFSLANERTFLAWQRTALGQAAAGMAGLHLLERTTAVWLLGVFLLGSAAGSAGIGWWRYRQAEQAMTVGLPVRPLTIAPLLAAALMCAVVAALVSVVL